MLSAGKHLNVLYNNGGLIKMIKFVIGIMVGGTIGFFTAAILAVGKRGDENEV